MSAELGSEGAVNETAAAEPSATDPPLPNVAVGATLVTLIVAEVVPVPPSLSVAARVTTYVPLSSGVNENDAEVPPEPNAKPFFVTLQAYVKPAVVSADEGSVTLEPSVIAVPSGLDAGAPVIVGVGATLVTLIVAVVVPVPPSLSVAARVTT